MSAQSVPAMRRLALAAWLALLISIACWPFGDAGIGPLTTALALLPLLAPLPGMARGTRRTLRWAPLVLALPLTLALTEILVNPAARTRAAVSLALLLAAFAAVIATLRRTAPD
jgi:uncharacterized membrane protein